MAKKKQEAKLKEPVRIRFKQLANGNQSIYLDYYTGDVIRKENYVGGKRQYEFLKLYLIPEKTREDKAKNETTLALAKAIQSKRIVELQNDAHGFQNTNKSKAGKSRIRCLPSGWHILILIRYLPSVRDRMCCGKILSIVISYGKRERMR